MSRLTASLATVALSLGCAMTARAQQATAPDDASRMLAMHAHDAPVPSGAVHLAAADVVSDTVVYATVNGKEIRGFRSRPRNAKKDAPAIILVHEWWGLNDNIRGMAGQYAGEGYVALAVDLYGTVAPTPDSAAKLYRYVMDNPVPARANLSGAIDFLRSQGAKKVGTVGWCFGGHWSLEAGLVGGSRVQAVVMYYGQPITDPKQLEQLDAPLLGFFGSQDTGIPADSVKAMAAELDRLGKSETLQFFDAGHGFANPSGKNYNATAAEAAWKHAMEFFRNYLK